jgi:2-methylcitrate dehydratase PrpD
MAISEERRKVLQMVEEGKLSPEDGARLLAALGQPVEEPEASAPFPSADAALSANGRCLRVRVSNVTTGKQKVSVNIPLGLVDFGLRFVPTNDKFDAEMLRTAIRDGLTGRIVEVLDDEKGERVEISIE